MLQDEVDIYLKLDHPNICKLLEVYEDDVAVHLVMELCDGESLVGKKYTEDEAAWMCMQMLRAIHYMHRHHVAHRDLKPDNWVRTGGPGVQTLKLIDFGISKAFRRGPMDSISGTSLFMAPEVWERQYDEKVDMWSLGVIIYILVTGARPYEGLKTNEIARRIKSEGISIDGPEWEHVSPVCKDFALKLLEDEPEDRLSAEEAMQHEWLAPFRRSPDAVKDLSAEVLQQLSTYPSRKVMLRAACLLAAFSMPPQELADLEQQFHIIDRESRGTINAEDLVWALTTKLQMGKDDARKVFDALDQIGDTEINFSEFIAASLPSRFRAREDLVNEVFRRFDVDGTGLISAENLREVLGDEYAGTTVEEIVASCDLNKDGFVDYEEFVEALSGREECN